MKWETPAITPAEFDGVVMVIPHCSCVCTDTAGAGAGHGD